MKTLAFCRKNGLLMENQGLGIHMVTKFQQIVLQKIPKIPQNLFGSSAQSVKIFGMFEKRLSFGVRSPWTHPSGFNSLTLLSLYPKVRY